LSEITLINVGTFHLSFLHETARRPARQDLRQTKACYIFRTLTEQVSDYIQQHSRFINEAIGMATCLICRPTLSLLLALFKDINSVGDDFRNIELYQHYLKGRVESMKRKVYR
jgi:hypothetical protein